MGATDRAFVKAFVTDTPPGETSDIAPQDGDAPEEARRTFVVQPPHAVVPAPHVAFHTGRQAHAEETAPREDRPLPKPSPESPRQAEPAHRDTIEAAFEVDRFTWPLVCRRLVKQTAEPLNRLTKVMLERPASPVADVLWAAGCQPGQGRTTMLLSLALLLAEGSRRVALVDANFPQGGMARRLGIAPVVGLDDVLRQGLPVSEAMIESLADAVTLVPLRDPVVVEKHASRWQSTLDVLRRHFDVVLVAAAPLRRDCTRAPWQEQDVAMPTDVALLVHRHRVTTPRDLDHACNVIRQSNVRFLALIENFAAAADRHAA